MLLLRAHKLYFDFSRLRTLQVTMDPHAQPWGWQPLLVPGSRLTGFEVLLSSPCMIDLRLACESAVTQARLWR